MFNQVARELAKVGLGMLHAFPCGFELFEVVHIPYDEAVIGCVAMVSNA